MVLGNTLGYSTGKIVHLRTLANGILEVTFNGKGEVLGHEIADNGTYTCEILENGKARVEGNVLLVANDGIGAWKGIGIGSLGTFPSGKFGVVGEFPKASGTLAHLGEVADVVEYKVDEEKNYRWDLYEWKFE